MKFNEVPRALTLAQLEKMDSLRILVPDSIYTDGGFYRVDVRMRLAFPLYFDGELSFLDYGKTWIATVDPFGVLEGGK